MKSTSSGLINLAFVWGIASAAGFAAMAGLMLLGGWGLVQGLFAAAIIFFALGALLSLLFLKPLPGPKRPGTAGRAAGTNDAPVMAAAPRTAPVTGAAVAVAAPATSAPTTPAPATPAQPPVDQAPPSRPDADLVPDQVEWPAAAPAPDLVAETGGTRPAALDAPRAVGADDLKKIKGIGPKLETLCHTLGFYHFDQIANWTPAEVAWVDDNLQGFKGRVTRDSWVEQARTLAAGGETEFARKVDKGGVY